MSPPVVTVKVWGEFALFSRPELSVERISYPVMTPSAARGVLDAILYKPEMTWHVRRIAVLPPNFPPGFPEGEARRPFRLVGVRRNEIQGTIAPRTVEGWMKDPASFQPYLVDSAGRDGIQGQNRTQRNSLVLHHAASPDAEGEKRLRRVARACEDYGVRVQKSVFECTVGEADWVRLRARLLAEVDLNQDSLGVYHLGADVQVEHHGAAEPIDLSAPLVV
jgi:CRISPR-associated protein Cas2